jgi:molecular chaperone DnaK (HSP70)
MEKSVKSMADFLKDNQPETIDKLITELEKFIEENPEAEESAHLKLLVKEIKEAKEYYS